MKRSCITVDIPKFRIVKTNEANFDHTQDQTL